MIDNFRGKYRFLSNFYMAKIEYEGLVYPSSEHAYQAAKTLDINQRRILQIIKKPGESKKHGNALLQSKYGRKDWHNIKNKIMYDIKNCIKNYLILAMKN